MRKGAKAARLVRSPNPTRDWGTDATQSRPYPRQGEKGAKRGSGMLVGGWRPRHKPL